MSYPSGDQNPPAGGPPYQYPPAPQGYPPYPQQPGYPPQTGYPQRGAYPPQAGFPQQPYAPYGQAGMPPNAYNPHQMYAQPKPAKEKNAAAVRALIYGALSLGVNIVGLFVGFYLTGILAVYAIFMSIRAMVVASRLPGKAGIGMAIGGLAMALLSLGITVLGFSVK